MEHLLRIRNLLYDQRFTIEGARTRLRELGHEEGPPLPLPSPDVSVETMRKMKQAVIELIALVEER